jgi:8-oxo-dGTP diphosphatase
MSKPGRPRSRHLAREFKEELGLDSQRWEFFRSYECLNGDTYPNRKFIYWGETNPVPRDLTLYEGQRLASFAAEERSDFKFANILGGILEDFIAASLWISFDAKLLQRFVESAAL